MVSVVLASINNFLFLHVIYKSQHNGVFLQFHIYTTSIQMCDGSYKFNFKRTPSELFTLSDA